MIQLAIGREFHNLIFYRIACVTPNWDETYKYGLQDNDNTLKFQKKKHISIIFNRTLPSSYSIYYRPMSRSVSNFRPFERKKKAVPVIVCNIWIRCRYAYKLHVHKYFNFFCHNHKYFKYLWPNGKVRGLLWVVNKMFVQVTRDPSGWRFFSCRQVYEVSEKITVVFR